MEIVQISGVQLEKSSPTSPEDGFIRSEVHYREGNEEKYFSLLYLQFFESSLAEITPFHEDPITIIGDKQYTFKEIAALAALLNNPDFKSQKRVYKHDIEEFKNLFKNVDWEFVNQTVLKVANQESNKVQV